MTAADLRLLCTALGFTTVIMQGRDVPSPDGARRAAALAGLIEEFCRATVPDLFSEHEEERLTDASRKFAMAERMASAIAELYKEKGGCLPQDLVAKGFAREEIDRHWAMAKAFAQVELNITDS